MPKFEFELECLHCGHRFTHPPGKFSLYGKNAQEALTKEVIVCPGINNVPHAELIWNGEPIPIQNRFKILGVIAH